MAWAVDLGVQITDVGRSLYIGSFCPAMTSLSRYLEEAAFSISISSSPTGQKQQLFDGKTVENKGKLILTEIFPSVQNMIFKSIRLSCTSVLSYEAMAILI